GSAGKEEVGFQVADVEDVAMLLEAATTAAGQANRAGGSHGRIHFPVHLQHLTANVLVHATELPGEKKKLQAYHLQAAADLRSGNQLPAAGAGTDLAGGLPGLGSGE